jgi:hypothetical protein
MFVERAFGPQRRLAAGVSADRMSALRAENPLHGGDWPSFFDPVGPRFPLLTERSPYILI